MTSPYHEDLGVHKYGEYVYEWRSLLNTPCYGFNGPNACYSSTCSHNPSLAASEKQLSKTKLPNSSKLLFKSHFNTRKPSSFERASDQSTRKLSLTSHLNVQMIAVDHNTNNTYKAYEQVHPGSYVYFDESPTTQVVCTNKTKDSHQFESFDLNGHLAANNSPLTSNVLSGLSGECMIPSYSHENGVSARKYAFNPLSEPFQPMRFTHSNTSLPDSFSSIPSPQSSSSLVSSSERSIYGPAESACSFDSYEINISPLKFVCILCPERYATLDELTAHINKKVHQPHTCLVCGSTYAHDYMLQRHLKLHRTLKSVRCRGCNKKFRSLNQLRKHFDVCQYKLHMLI